MARQLRLELDRVLHPTRSDLVVSAQGGRYQLSRMLWCADAAHADAVAGLTERVHVRQWALAREIAAAGVPIAA